MNKTFGILAHVDAGKTTFSEQLLFHTNQIRKRGRVDHGDAFLDYNEIERERGITVFSEQAAFDYGENRYFLLDTPGHADFSAEMERAVQALDYAVLLVSCAEGVQSHTETVWKLLEQYHKPVFLFLNKIDRAGAEVQRTLSEIRTRLTPDILPLGEAFSHGNLSEELAEQVAELDDLLLEEYLDTGYQPEHWLEALRRMISERRVFPCFSGSALQDQGIEGFLQDFDLLTETDYQDKAKLPFSALAYKVRHDSRGNRVVFLKLLQGQLKPRDEIPSLLPDGSGYREKANELRCYNGEKYSSVPLCTAGELCAVTGLSQVQAGEIVGANARRIQFHVTPTLTAKVFPDPSLPLKTVLERLRILEEEDPLLQVRWEEALQEIQIRIMGEIQLEILKELAKQRFEMELSFGDCEVLYQETITNSVIGYGHYEPLRHYAEVHLALSPGQRGSGITFESSCSTDVLDKNWQNLIRTHVFEKQHKGILTGSPLTDVHISLVTGRSHLKHTEGGDFREAVYRAVRQGLEQADCLVLEPFYSFTISAEQEQLGRILSDIQRMDGAFQPPDMENGRVLIRGRGPASSFLNYSRELTSFSHGKGSVSLSFDGYEPCHNQEEVIARISYDKTHDLENPSGSIFCSHGAGFTVPWDQVPNYIHC